MEKISDRTGDAPLAYNVLIAVAKSYEKRQKFNDAYLEWSLIASKWPTGQIGKEALLAMGRCKHADYRGPKYDASSLISAKSYYEDFKSRYSEEAKTYNIDEKLRQIKEQSGYKQFCIGQYYQKTDSLMPANSYYEMVMADWPDSTAAKMAKIAVEKEKTESKKEEKWQTQIMKKLEKLLL